MDWSVGHSQGLRCFLVIGYGSLPGPSSFSDVVQYTSLQYTHHWKRNVLQAIHIQRQVNTSNLDCGLQISPLWLPLIKKLQWSPSSLYFFPIYLFFSPLSLLTLYHIRSIHWISVFHNVSILFAHAHTRVMLLLFGHLCFQSQVVLTADEGLRVDTFCFTKCFFTLQ